MKKSQAAQVAEGLRELGFRTQLQETERGVQVRGHAAFSSVMFFEEAEGLGFLQGVRFALANLAKPSIY